MNYVILDTYRNQKQGLRTVSRRLYVVLEDALYNFYVYGESIILNPSCLTLT